MKKVYCPYCREEVSYRIERRDVKEFKGVEINTFEDVAVCAKCNEDLYVGSIEDKNTERICSLYREKADIIKKEDIIKFREKYKISQRELTSIFGFGKMTINRYESGYLPSKSQSDYIKLIINNENEFIKLVEEAYKKGNITEKTYTKITNISKGIIVEETFEERMQDILRRYIKSELTIKGNFYTGFNDFDLEKVENIISYIASKVKNLTITSLNKYLWFIDIIYFNKQTLSITGLTYQNQKFGPTIINQMYNEISLLNEKYKREDHELENGTMTTIVSKGNYDLSELRESEIETIDLVINLLKDKSVTEISELSHKEDGWKKTKRFEKISFEHAMNLNIIE